MIETFSTRKDKPQSYPALVPSEIGVGVRKYLFYEPIEFAISPNGKDWTSDYDVPDLTNIYCYSAPGVQPATMSDNLRKVGLQDGSRLLSTTYSTRELTMKLISYGNFNESDVMLGYDALQRFLVSRDAYWICFANWPHRMYYVKAKMSAPTYTSMTGWSVDVTFTDLIGLSRSVGTTGDYDNMVLGFGNNEPLDRPQYQFTTNHFTVDNTSDVRIDPERRGHPFVLTLEGSSNGNMKITNKTTDEHVVRSGILLHDKDGKEVRENTNFSGKWVLNGVRKTLNGKSDNFHCSSGVLTLAKGPNEFQIDNFNGTVTFDYAEWWLS